MKLFNFRKSKDNSQQLPEVRSFADAERRERTSLAWVIGIVSLIVMLLLLALLFFTGRWAYNRLTSDDKPTTSETSTESDQEKSDKSSTDDKKDSDNNPDSNNSGNSGDKNNPDSLPGDTDAADEPRQTTPTTGPSEPEDLPRTGPELDL